MKIKKRARSHLLIRGGGVDVFSCGVSPDLNSIRVALKEIMT